MKKNKGSMTFMESSARKLDPAKKWRNRKLENLKRDIRDWTAELFEAGEAREQY